MNCSICGGTLKSENGLYVCSNCGAKQQISAFFENVDVFICYQENDEQGRRTKDSVIANDLYNKLQDANIKTFYQRISVSNLTGEYYHNACKEAFDRAKIILILGTSRAVFDVLLNENTDRLSGKTIIPVFSYIGANDMPEQLANLQAVNYDNIGASSDLTKNILHILGRDTEIDAFTFASEQERKRKIRLFSIITLIATLIIIAALYFIFGTSYFLKSKKYEYANKLSQNGNYIEAIKLYSDLDNYENSANILKSLYNKYEGYFNNDDKTLCIYLNIDDNLKTEIEVIKIVDGKTVRINTSTVIDKSNLSFVFTDSQKNPGSGTIELLNDGIKLSTSMDTQSELSIGNIDCLFKLDNRTDAPISAPITKEDLISWITIKTTESDLKQRGFELNLIDTISDGSAGYYNIKGTDIELVLFSVDLSQEIVAADEFSVDLLQDTVVTDKIIFGVSAPANLLIPDKVGSKAYVFYDDNILYGPNKKLYYQERSPGLRGPLYFKNLDNEENSELINQPINDNTTISIASNIIGDYYWEYLLSSLVESEAAKKYGFAAPDVYSIEKWDNADDYLYYINTYEQEFTATYRVNKQTYDIEFVREIPIYKEGYYDYTVWAAAPDLVEEFDIPVNETNAQYLPMVSGLSGNIVSSSSDYLFNSDTQYITREFLSTKTQTQVRLILNEMYARHGYIFTSDEFKSYFSDKSWYQPRYSSSKETESYFNSIEKENKRIITEYEASMGWR